ncbi:hypothetical protein [Desulfoplanes formicivorans]|uniref:Uncharacterized protein n=1 Tax=Desulfoplanes formicivorans TaxID=1592317 RepID=A0A194AC02_9BACT|nr:hypothetical protein [Desulfoplanes formicivorans]GAU07677.1 hypothetical protein DPF_0372 [Desulfoplanes formicivorans]
MNIARYYILGSRSALRMVGNGFKQKKRTFVRKNNVTNSVLYDDVVAWQKKQIASMSFEDSVPSKSGGVIDIGKMRTIHRRTLLEVEHREDGMWKVSTDTLQKGKGISLDQAIVLMHRLRDAGFPDDALGVVSVQLEQQRHSFAIIQYAEDDFWMLDNGYFSVFPVRASRFLAKRDDIVYLIGFNFFDVWTY